MSKLPLRCPVETTNSQNADLEDVTITRERYRIIPENGTESEQETDVLVKSEPEAVVWIKSEARERTCMDTAGKEDPVELDLKVNS